MSGVLAFSRPGYFYWDVGAMTIQLYDFSQDEGLIELFELVMGHPMGRTESSRHFQWQYLDNPAGRAYVMVFKNEQGEIVSAYSAFPLFMKLGEERFKCSFSLDIMNHPDYRGQRIFTKLGKEFFDYLQQNQVPITYGYTNKNSHNLVTKRLQYLHIDDFPLTVKILRSSALFKRYLKNSILSRVLGVPTDFILNILFPVRGFSNNTSLRIQLQDEFDSRIDELWQDVRHLFPVCIERDYNYLRWRYSAPEETYRIITVEDDGKLAGYAVIKLERKFGLNIGFIMDFISRPEIDINSFIKAVTLVLRDMGAELASALNIKSSIYYPWFKKNGFISIPPRFQPQEIYFVTRINIHNEYTEMVKVTDNWHVSWGDTDVL